MTIAAQTNLKEDSKTYPVKKITEEIRISGKGDDPLWGNAFALSDFTYPWEAEIPQHTKFKALHNDVWLYFFFDVMDDQIKIHIDKNEKTEVAASCRAEIFFKKDDRLSPYYCLEIDPLARVLDYKAQFHRQFDMTWSWPSGHLVVKSKRRKNGYSVEFAISKESLQELGLLKNNQLQTGLYRADCIEQNENAAIFKWISWVKPDSKTPDFHIPSSFGVLQLEK